MGLLHLHPLFQWYYGHFHNSCIEIIDGVHFSMLSICEMKELAWYPADVRINRVQMLQDDPAAIGAPVHFVPAEVSRSMMRYSWAVPVPRLRKDIPVRWKNAWFGKRFWDHFCFIVSNMQVHMLSSRGQVISEHEYSDRWFGIKFSF